MGSPCNDLISRCIRRGVTSGVLSKCQLWLFVKAVHHGYSCFDSCLRGGMAHYYRLMLWALLAFSGVAYGYPATSSVPAGACSVSPCYKYNNPFGNPGLINTAQEVCVMYAASQSDARFVYSGAAVSGNNCTANFHDNYGYVADGVAVWNGILSAVVVPPTAPSYSCPAGGTLSGSSCTCPTPASDTGSSCQSAKPLIDALNAAGQGLQYKGSPSLTSCFQGTTLRASGAACGPPSPGADNCTSFPPFQDTGVACVGAGAVGSNGLPAANTEPPIGTPSNCAAGLIPGQVNGVGVCLKPSVGNTVQSSSSGGTSTITNPDGSPGGSTVTGGKQTTADTTCAGSTCTTKTETTSQNPGGGSTVSQELKSESKDDFCTKNPKSPLCVSSSFGGACSGGFVCDGDAIQCALAREVYAQNCKLNARNSNTDLFDIESIKTGNRTLDLPGNATVNVGASSFDQSNALGVSAQCIQDVTISVMGNSAVLPFSRVCSMLEQLGSVLLAVSFILAARIVTRG